MKYSQLAFIERQPGLDCAYSKTKLSSHYPSWLLRRCLGSKRFFNQDIGLATAFPAYGVASPTPSHRQGVGRLQVGATHVKRCGSMGGKVPMQEMAAGRKHKGVALTTNTRELHACGKSCSVPTPPARRCPHPFTPIERGSEGEGKRIEKGREEET